LNPRVGSYGSKNQQWKIDLAKGYIYCGSQPAGNVCAIGEDAKTSATPAPFIITSDSSGWSIKNDKGQYLNAAQLVPDAAVTWSTNSSARWQITLPT
jgi:hypothetical protein